MTLAYDFAGQSLGFELVQFLCVRNLESQEIHACCAWNQGLYSRFTRRISPSHLLFSAGPQSLETV